jgi:hypothetical protein
MRVARGKNQQILFKVSFPARFINGGIKVGWSAYLLVTSQDVLAVASFLVL